MLFRERKILEEELPVMRLKEGIFLNMKSQKPAAYASAVLILVFFLLVTIGSYIKIKTGVVISFTAISFVLFLLDYRRMGFSFFKSPMTYLWISYALVGVLSTVFVAGSRDLYILYSQVSFTIILFVLAGYTDGDSFFRCYRIFVLIFVIAAFYEIAAGKVLFAFLKKGTQFALVDDQAHGILSIFEYRHYFGCYLLLAFFSIFYFPEKKWLLNLLYGLLFFAAIIVTFTRSIWIALFVGFFLLLASWFLKRKKHPASAKSFSIKKRKAFFVTLIVLILVLVSLGVAFRTQLQSITANVLQRLMDINPANGSWFKRTFTLIHGPEYMFRNPSLLPIGGGAGSALRWLETAEGAQFRGAIDCQYVHTFMETGIIGLAVFLGMLIYAFIRFFRSAHTFEKMMTLQYIAMAVAFFFFEVVVVNSSVFALWSFVLVGIIWKNPAEGRSAQK